jgi:hypothetical protein
MKKYFILKVRLLTEIVLVFGSIAYLLGALREYMFLGKKTFKETLAMCPGRVCFLIACVLVLFMIPARVACFAGRDVDIRFKFHELRINYLFQYFYLNQH